MHRGGRLVLSAFVSCLILAGCQSSPEPDSRQPAEAAQPPTSSAPDATPSEPAQPEDQGSTREISLPKPERGARGMVAELPPTKTASFAMVGVTWDKTSDDADVSVQVRVHTNSGWSSWETLEVDDDGGESSRGGTEPWWVAEADQVSARVTAKEGRAPTGVRVVAVDPGSSRAPVATTSPAMYRSGTASAVVSAADGRPAFTGQPRVISRGQWSARAADGCDEDGYSAYGSSTQGIVLHHTAGSNTYTASQSYAIVRSTQRFHMDGRGWCDIAYNFLVDKYGQIFEGRAGGIDRAVRGSHSGNNGVNEMTMGVSLIGNLDKAKPSTAMKNATVKLVGWRIGTTYLPAKGTVRIGGKTLNRIAGHRNVVSTSCPGKYGYAWLGAKGGLRDRVAAYVSGYSSAIKTAQSRVSPSTKGAVVIGEAGVRTRRTVFTKLDYYWTRSYGAHAVISGFRTTYDAAAGSAGGLGFPVNGIVLAAGGDRQQFQFGAIYGKLAGPAFAVYGPIYDVYQGVGDVTGELGAPTSRMVQSGAVKTVQFEHGTITQNGSTPPVVSIDGAPAGEAPPVPPVEPTEPTPGPTDESVAPTSWDTSDLVFLRSGMISA